MVLRADPSALQWTLGRWAATVPAGRAERMETATGKPDFQVCQKCGESKPQDAYNRIRTGEPGHHKQCKACMKLYQKQKRNARPTGSWPCATLCANK